MHDVHAGNDEYPQEQGGLSRHSSAVLPQLQPGCPADSCVSLPSLLERHPGQLAHSLHRGHQHCSHSTAQQASRRARGRHAAQASQASRLSSIPPKIATPARQESLLGCLTMPSCLRAHPTEANRGTSSICNRATHANQSNIPEQASWPALPALSPLCHTEKTFRTRCAKPSSASPALGTLCPHTHTHTT